MKRPIRMIAVAAAVALAISSCGSDDDGASTTAAPPAETTGAAEPTDTEAGSPPATEAPGEAPAESGYVDEVKALVQGGLNGLLYTSVEDKDATVSDLEPRTGWQGPAETPAPPADMRVAILICIAGTTCEEAAVASAEAAEALGWQVDLIEAQATPESYEEAMRQALANDVDGIITTAMPDVIVGAQLAEASERGIPTVGMSAVPVENAAAQYDVYVPARETLSAMMQAWYAIADSDGQAEAVYLWDTGYPHLQEALSASQRVLSECDSCSLRAEEARTTADFANPVAIGDTAKSLGQREGGPNTYMMTAYDLGIPAIVQATSEVGADVRISTKNAHPSSLELIAQGELMMDSGTSSEWVGYAAIDQLIRLMAGEEPIPYWEQGLPLRVFDSTNVPEGRVFDWLAEVDFKSEYLKLWGVS
jgi:ribose transport system substrate-binding protein